ncbi:type VII secretion-associated serine protease mycosin [Actinoallomurus bryophytorum]|uniref:Type VII secretion-associated serine protease mycosin n=1 Tax=Actinoallomurus bryophytorum TaxID=1490222 RepID=A0A543CEV3_9ACTN|nr:S8 family serine peptidase [Actinoallomurus bryophytorum]TQL95632.1 type VII secretion-associated serine protease mycosin [Actinoallomurus bryophytorum]
MEVLRRSAALLLALAVVSGPTLALRPSPAHADEVRSREQWVLDAVSAERAWHVTRGKGVTVAVLDTGVDGSHLDLSGSVTTGPDYIHSVAPHAGRLHGTWMSSLVAGHGHGANAGIIGIAPEAHVLAVRTIADPEEPGYHAFRQRFEYRDALHKAIRYAADHGADVINMSLGGPGVSTGDRAAVAYAISKGVVVVASAGNEGDSKSSKKVDKNGLVRLSYPAAIPGVIGVAALKRGGEPAKFSDRNSSVLVAAPGSGVVGAGPSDTYWDGDGTSQAGAIVSGVAALIRAKYHDLAPALVAQAISASATHRPKSGWNEKVGFGEVDAAAALTEAGRLSRYKEVTDGRTGRFDEGPIKPVQVERHPPGLVILGGWVGVAALFGLAGAVMSTVLLVRRIRARREDAEEGAGYDGYTGYGGYGG